MNTQEQQLELFPPLDKPSLQIRALIDYASSSYIEWETMSLINHLEELEEDIRKWEEANGIKGE